MMDSPESIPYIVAVLFICMSVVAAAWGDLIFTGLFVSFSVITVVDFGEGKFKTSTYLLVLSAPFLWFWNIYFGVVLMGLAILESIIGWAEGLLILLAYLFEGGD